MMLGRFKMKGPLRQDKSRNRQVTDGVICTSASEALP
jgi:hypothetical protein